MDRVAVTYLLTCGADEDPERKARDIAFEQTAELPPACVSAEIRSRSVGRVESLTRLPDLRWRAVVSFPLGTVGETVQELLTVLFGNISLKSGILVTGVDLPPALLGRMPGPRYGVEGMRALCHVPDAVPLLCTALKPVGLSCTELAALCRAFVLGGMDIIKDDHGLAFQPWCSFRERAARCQEAVSRANEEAGRRCVYFPNLVAGSPRQLGDDVEYLQSLGCVGVLVSPMLLGFDNVRWLAEASGLAIMSHPALTGAFFREDHGIAPDLLLGRLFRLVGSDAVIYPNAGGRFVFSPQVCEGINASLRGDLGAMPRSFPVPAGGIDMDRVGTWLRRYGPDTIFLIGGSLYAREDLESACRALRSAVGRPL